MAIMIGVFNPRKKLRGLCAIPECEHEIAGVVSEDLPAGGQLLCRCHLDEFAEREIERIQES